MREPRVIPGRSLQDAEIKEHSSHGAITLAPGPRNRAEGFSFGMRVFLGGQGHAYTSGSGNTRYFSSSRAIGHLAVVKDRFRCHRPRFHGPPRCHPFVLFDNRRERQGIAGYSRDSLVPLDDKPLFRVASQTRASSGSSITGANIGESRSLADSGPQVEPAPELGSLTD